MEGKSEIKKKYFSIGVLFWLAVLIAMSYWIYHSQEKVQNAPLVDQQNQSIIKPPKIIVSNQKRSKQQINQQVNQQLNQSFNPTDSNSSIESVESNEKTNLQINSPPNPATSSVQSNNSDHYWIQISTYSKENRNIALVKHDELRELGVRSSIIPSQIGFKLVVGPYDDLNIANIEKNKIRGKIGISDIFVYREENQ